MRKSLNRSRGGASQLRFERRAPDCQGSGLRGARRAAKFTLGLPTVRCAARDLAWGLVKSTRRNQPSEFAEHRLRQDTSQAAPPKPPRG